MKKIFFATLSAMLLLALGSCHKDPEPTESYLKTKELREKYRDKLIGQWHATFQSNREKVYSAYDFKSDGQYSHYVKCVTRDSMNINGEPIYGNWRVIEDKTTDGQWYLSWIDGDDYNALVLKRKSKSGNSTVGEVRPFDYTDGQTAVFQDIWISMSMATFKKGAPGADF